MSSSALIADVRMPKAMQVFLLNVLARCNDFIHRLKSLKYQFVEEYAYASFLATTNICLANGRIGELRYIFVNQYDLGRRDFREKGMNRGMAFVTFNPELSKKSTMAV
jgi:hypothetical protein